MEQYDENTIKQLDIWVLGQKEKGFSLDQIKQSMINNGYDSDFCEEYIAGKSDVETESVNVTNNQTQINYNSSQTTKTNIAEPKANPWQTNNTLNVSLETLSESQKQEKFKNYSYFDKVKLILTKPKLFFDEMPQEVGYKAPIMFATVNFSSILH